jgi:hypothetical protein
MAVIMQKKFFVLHWVVLLAPVTAMCANGARDLREIVPRFQRSDGAGPVAMAAMLIGLWWLTPGRQLWVDESALVIDYLKGSITRAEFARFFQIPGIGFWYENSEQLGNWLRENTAPDEPVVVRGFQPEVYAIAQRRYPGRFFWTTFLTSGTRGEPALVEKWVAEDNADLERARPRFVATLTGIHHGPDSAEWFFPRGYVLREVMGQFTLLERSPAVSSTAP